MVQRWTPSGVRLRLQSHRPGLFNWLLLPGGPGFGSESLEGLARVMNDVSGNVWLVDLPGDGSNLLAPGAGDDPYAKWPHVLLEAAQAVPKPIFVGHSTGGMYLLSIPELESRLVGLVLVSSAPDASWMQTFAATTRSDALPDAAAAQNGFTADPTNDTLGKLAVCSAPWNFTAEGLRVGKGLFARMPYNCAAVQWSAAHFDSTYEARWWPAAIPTLILSGEHDRVVDQHAWDAPRFHGAHVVRQTIAGGAHFPWVERPESVREAIVAFDEMLSPKRAPTTVGS